MKKYLLVVGVLTGIVILAAFTSTSGGGGISKGEMYTNFSFPDSITASKTVLFPTGYTLAPTWASDSANVKVREFYTYIAPAAMTGNRRVKLSNQTYVTIGAQLWIAATSDSIRNLIVVQANRSDTMSVRYSNNMGMVYNGSAWVPVSIWKAPTGPTGATGPTGS